MEVKCYNKKCLHIWNYRGKDKRFICCPKCRFKRILDKCRSFFLSKSDILNDRPTNRPTNILPSEPIKSLPIQLKQDKESEFERVYFPDGFDCLIHKDIVPQFKKLTLKDLQEEAQIREIESVKTIRTIPRDPIKILEHQRSFL